MKKVILVVCMILILVGCGNQEKDIIIEGDSSTENNMVENIDWGYDEETFSQLYETSDLRSLLENDKNFMTRIDSLLSFNESFGIADFDFEQADISIHELAQLFYHFSVVNDVEEFLNVYYPDKIELNDDVKEEYDELSSGGGHGMSSDLMRIRKAKLYEKLLEVEIETLEYADEGDNILVEGYTIDEYEDDYYEKFHEVTAKIEKDWKDRKIPADNTIVLRFTVDKENRVFIPILKNELYLYTEYSEGTLEFYYEKGMREFDVLVFSDYCDLDLDGIKEKVDIVRYDAYIYEKNGEYKLHINGDPYDGPNYCIKIDDYEKEFRINPVDEVDFIAENGINKLKFRSAFRDAVSNYYIYINNGEVVVEEDLIEKFAEVDNALFRWNREDGEAIITGIYEYKGSNGNATILDNYTGKMVRIPENIDGYKVTEIRKGTFDNCKSEYVVIPESVEKIDEGAIPDSVKILKRAPIFNLETIEMLDETGNINSLLGNDNDFLNFVDLISDNCDDFDINEGISLKNISTILEIAFDQDKTENKGYVISKELDELIELYYPDKKTQKDELEKMSEQWCGFDNVMHFYRIVNSQLEGVILTIQYEELHDYECIGLEDLSDEKFDEAVTSWENGIIEGDYKAVFKFKVDEENMIFIPIYKKEI